MEKYDNQILKEDTKIQLVDDLYSKETLETLKERTEDKSFYERFQEAFSVLDNIIDYDTSKKKEQSILRNIENIEVIPKCIYEENLVLFKQYEESQTKKEKYKLRKELDKLFISIYKSNIKTLCEKLINCPYLKNKYIIDTKYDKEKGLLLEKDEDYDLSTREL